MVFKCKFLKSHLTTKKNQHQSNVCCRNSFGSGNFFLKFYVVYQYVEYGNIRIVNIGQDMKRNKNKFINVTIN